MKKWVYNFEEGNAKMRELLGGKGANLAEMTNLGLPIPPGFTITTEACIEYFKLNNKISKEILLQVEESLKQLEKKLNKKFGDEKNPLLVSVRSGARASMPGMMDTILNLGLNDKTVIGLANKSNNKRFAYDSYRRFIHMFSDVVMGIKKEKFENLLTNLKKEKKVTFDNELEAEDLIKLVSQYKELYKKELNKEFPQNPKEQLEKAIEAVFKSWNTQRAIIYRKMNDIPDDWGTAVNIQTMVFGNLGNTSGTGVAFTRNPATGEKKIYGEYLINAQGEDVVAGIRTPSSIDQMEKDLPDCYKEFLRIANILEKHYKDMQDMEFTIMEGKLYFLQTRNGKRTAKAALEIACDLVDNNIITKEEALLRIEPNSLNQLLHPKFNEEDLKNAKLIGKGLPASPGCSTGKIYFNAESAKKAKERKEKVILVRTDTSPEDIEGMHVSEGILTVHGGMTSHAAVVARGMGRCCISGCGNCIINEEDKNMELGGYIIKEGDYLSLDGNTGCVYLGKINTNPATIDGNLKRILSWADEIRKLKVLTNADTINDAKQAREYGAEGIGLCRSEHMFFNEERIPIIREMILSKTIEQRQRALNKLMKFQKEDYIGLFEVMLGFPVTIRLLDPPLHEFLPKEEKDIIKLAKDMDMSLEELKEQIDNLKEVNPMMGHRGCRLDVTYPEIGRMQARAIIEAAIFVSKKHNTKIEPEIMIPIINDIKELKFVKNIIVEEVENVLKENNYQLDYKIGTMIEIPRAALLSDELAQEAEFFSFGTNDLTQMTFGLSRDDAAKFLNSYYDNKIYDSDPFAHIDEQGVGQLIKIAKEKGRKIRPNLKLGVCGEHGGDSKSIEFFNKLDLDYVSCSPFRVSIARLAAAISVLKNK